MNKALAPLIALTMAGCVNAFPQGSGAIKGSGKVTTQTRNVRNFSSVMLDGSANVKVVIGKTFSVKVTTDDNLQKLFQTKLVGTQLVLGQTEQTKATKGVQVTITMPQLKRFDVDGAGKAEISGLNGGALAIGVDGAGNITAVGRVDELVVNLDGAGNLDLYKLKARDVIAQMAGAGNIRVNAIGTLRAKVNGVGNIRYTGSPKVQGRVDGIGTIQKGSG